MLSFLKRTKPAFVIDFPQISITPDTQTFIASLKASDIEYTLVTNGYITFAGKAFACDIPLMFGVHFNKLRIEFIEVFRPLEYYQSDTYDISESFSQLSDVLRKQYGKPLVTTAASIGGHPCEQWHTSNYIVNHYIMDRFGIEEHLHINFYKK
ncbi:MAG: hypothetical protein E7453_03860 [Ruminococcaceae bacterium]|nr:hypothetical protein [Oscillospiraceae bacterium]